MQIDWKKLPIISWISIILSVGFFGYGVYCVVTQQGTFIVPFHSIEMGSIGDGMPVQGAAAVWTGIAYMLSAVLAGSYVLWREQPEPSEEIARNLVFMFVAAILCLLVALFSM